MVSALSRELLPFFREVAELSVTTMAFLSHFCDEKDLLASSGVLYTMWGALYACPVPKVCLWDPLYYQVHFAFIFKLGIKLL